MTDRAPRIPLKAFKRTKIVATVGPATNSYDKVLELLKEGVNAIRLNFSHGTEVERSEQIAWIRKASKELSKPVAIIQDLQGPKVRLGDFEGIINVSRGEILTFKYKADYARSGHIPLQYDLAQKVRPGDRFLIFDGKVKTTILSVKDSVIQVRVETDGILVKRKGINVPDTDFESDIITAKDKKDLAFGSTTDIDYVGLSFVQNANDIANLRNKLRTLGSKARIIAKIETKSATENIEEIIREADAVMVARGDLAVETSAESVPIIQRRIIELGKKHAKPTIVATQMLASMCERPEPTRAEVSDVATAVLSGADSVMLSDETASGKYPIESIKVMDRVLKYNEAHTTQTIESMTEIAIVNRTKAIARAIIALADSVAAVAIVAETKSGATAQQIAANRSPLPIIAVTPTDKVAAQLAIVYGVKSFVRPDDKMQATKLTNWLLRSKVLDKGDIVVTASGRHPGVVGTTDTIKVRAL